LKINNNIINKKNIHWNFLKFPNKFQIIIEKLSDLLNKNYYSFKINKELGDGVINAISNETRRMVESIALNIGAASGIV
jgi:hypothetical protein